MLAEDLVAQSSPHGVNFETIARVKGHQAQAGTNRARGRETLSFARPQWSLAELGQAAQGVPPVMFMAACYAFAGAVDYLWPLQRALQTEAEQLAQRHNWPVLVLDLVGLEVRYLPTLAKLVLDVDAHPNAFAVAPETYPVYMNVPNRIWSEQLTEKFNALQAVWLGWLGSAAATIQARLSQEEEVS